jgi:putative RNA 2'-phosphotransferase
MIDEQKLKRISRRMSRILRHDTEGLSITKDGWVKVSDLLKHLSISKTDLDWIVDNNDKKRFSYDKHQLRIRASQGHSLDVSMEMKKVVDVEVLYHGTSQEIKHLILKEGLKPMSRTYVHMSKDIETATKVGSRKSSKIIILHIDAKSMIQDSKDIFISENGVYLTEYVDPKYIKVIF